MTTKNPVFYASSYLPAWVPAVYACAFFAFALVGGRAQTFTAVFQMFWLVTIGVVLLLVACIRRRAEVAADGIEIRWILTRRTIPFADVRRAVPKERKSVAITTMGGTELTLSAGYLDEAGARDMLERFWKTLSAGAEEGVRGAEREMLARSGRTTQVWREALRGLSTPGGYRQLAFAVDRLVAIAENPGVTSDLRVAALVALTAHELDTLSRDRLQRIAETTADPKLRAVLEAVATPGAKLTDHDADLALEAF